MFLTPEELIDLTHAKRTGTQVRALQMMGIEHKIRPDGTVAVLRAHVEAVFGGTGENEQKRPRKKTQPNFDNVP